MDNIFTAIVSR